jgi:hypothetical protein
MPHPYTRALAAFETGRLVSLGGASYYVMRCQSFPSLSGQLRVNCFIAVDFTSRCFNDRGPAESEAPSRMIVNPFPRKNE